MPAAFEPDATRAWVHVAAHFGLCGLSVALWRAYGHRWLAWLAGAWACAATTVVLDALLRSATRESAAADTTYLGLGLLTAGLFAVGFAALLGHSTCGRRTTAWLPASAITAAVVANLVGWTGAPLVRTVAVAQTLVFVVAGAKVLQRRSRRHRTGSAALAVALLIGAAAAGAGGWWLPFGPSALAADPWLGPLTLLAHMGIGVGVAIWALEFEHDLLQRAADTLQEWDREQFARKKAETVRRMAGGVAHGFNNLMTSVLGHADLIEDETRGSSTIAASIHEIREAVQRGATLTHRLLTVSSQRTERAEPLDIDRYLAEAAAGMRERLGEQVHLVFDQGAAGRHTLLPKPTLHLIVDSVLANARDAMPQGGRVVISTHVEADDVRLTISDSGTGMDPETLAQATDPFFTTKPVGMGDGLGLATVRGLTEKHGGSVKIHSTPGEGTIVTFRFPLHEGSGDPATLAEQDLRPTLATGTILLVEDDAKIRELLKQQLTTAGHSVMAADDGAAALRILDAMDHDLDLVLTDVAMPRMNGIALAREIARRPKSIPVRFISGYTRDTQLTDGIAAQDLLAKPFHRQQLLAFVQRAIRTDRTTPVTPNP